MMSTNDWMMKASPWLINAIIEDRQQNERATKAFVLMVWVSAAVILPFIYGAQ